MKQNGLLGKTIKAGNYRLTILVVFGVLNFITFTNLWAGSQTNPASKFIPVEDSQTVLVDSSKNRSGQDYLIVPGDLLEISVLPNEEFSQNVLVQTDGEIYLPALGHISTNGLTIKKLSRILLRKLSLYAPNIQVSIALSHFVTVKPLNNRLSPFKNEVN